MMLCTVVPKLSVALFIFPPGLVEKLPDYRPPLPQPSEFPQPSIDPELKVYRHYLLRLEAQAQHLEAQSGDKLRELRELMSQELWLRERIARLKQPRPAARGAWMPLVSPEQLRELRGLPPVPRKPPDRD